MIALWNKCRVSIKLFEGLKDNQFPRCNFSTFLQIFWCGLYRGRYCLSYSHHVLEKHYDVKVNESRYIEYLWSADLPKKISQLIMSIFFIFSQYFSQYILPGGKSFSQFIVSIFYLFSIFFPIDFTRWRKIFLNWLWQYFFSVLIIFFYRFYPVEKVFLNWLCQYLSFLNIFFNWFCQIETVFLSWLCQYLSFLNIFSTGFSRWKSFSQLIVSIFIFPPYFFNRICPVEKFGGNPTLLISWFIDFNGWKEQARKTLWNTEISRFLESRLKRKLWQIN